MKNVLKYAIRFFAVLGFGVALVSVAGWVMVLFHQPPELPKHIVLSFDFTGEVNESSSPSPLHVIQGKEDGDLALRDVVAALDLAAKDPRVNIVLGRFGENMGSLAAGEEIRAAMLRVREAGKYSYAFAHSFGEIGPADKAYYLASAFDEIWLQPLGLVGLTGLAIEMPFFGDVFKKYGVVGDFVHREEYKSAMDMFTENDFTSANAAMLGDMLDDLNAQMVNAIAADRTLEPLRLMQLMDEAPISAEKALKENLIDGLGYKDEIEDTALEDAGEGAEIVNAADYLALRRHEIRDQKNDAAIPTIALIHAVGEIAQGRAAGMQGEDSIDADDMVQAIEDAVNDDKVEAILLRLDSPGGSATASENIRRALSRAQGVGLPVVVSMGGMAGSGAYWLAADADAILADAATLTGSIGVVAGKFAGTHIWEDLGINWSGITRGAHASMWSASAPFTPAEKEKLNALVDETYAAFKQRVVDGRDLSPDAVAALAKGRVWTGGQAEDNGLIDEVGDFTDTVLYTKNLLGLTEQDSVLMKAFPAPESPLDRLFHFLEQMGGLGVSLQRLHGVMQPLLPVLHGLMTMNGLHMLGVPAALVR